MGRRWPPKLGMEESGEFVPDRRRLEGSKEAEEEAADAMVEEEDWA